jgi:hypothetical protein
VDPLKPSDIVKTAQILHGLDVVNGEQLLVAFGTGSLFVAKIYVLLVTTLAIE